LDAVRDDTYTPFAGKRASPAPGMRVLCRFTKPGGHVAEICERTVTQFRATEFIVFVDGGLSESQMFHGDRLDAYPRELAARVQQFLDGGWVEDLTAATIATG
jgi:hypothetical protein